MKIKLRDYSLINNEWIDKEIDRLERIKKESDVTDYSIVGQLISLIKLKEQLILSEKLADVCFEAEEKRGYEIPALQMGAIPISEAENPNKQEFLNSEIEIQ